MAVNPRYISRYKISARLGSCACRERRNCSSPGVISQTLILLSLDVPTYDNSPVFSVVNPLSPRKIPPGTRGLTNLWLLICSQNVNSTFSLLLAYLNCGVWIPWNKTLTVSLPTASSSVVQGASFFESGLSASIFNRNFLLCLCHSLSFHVPVVVHWTISSLVSNVQLVSLTDLYSCFSLLVCEVLLLPSLSGSSSLCPVPWCYVLFFF